MTTPIHINDHDALNAAFAEKVAGWRKYESPTSGGRLFLPYRYFDGDGIPRIEVDPFTRSMDAVLPWLDREHAWVADRLGSRPKRPHVVVYTDAYGTKHSAFAPTLPHAAVVALLMAKGVTITEGDNT